MTNQELQTERDDFRQAFECKLKEHAQTLSELQDARAKLAASRAHAAKMRSALEKALLDYEGYLTRADGAWECASCGAFAGTGDKPERLGKAHREGCGSADWIEIALAATPAEALAAVGAERAARELRNLCIAPGQDAMDVMEQRAAELDREAARG